MYYQDHHIPEQTNQVFNQFFERMPNLEKLTAGFGNGFVFGEEEASSLANVKDLWFYTGPKYVNETFPAMPKLEKANFSSTSSTGNAPQYVENMKNLASLSIGRFTRSGIPEWVYELPEIRHLQVF